MTGAYGINRMSRHGQVVISRVVACFAAATLLFAASGLAQAASFTIDPLKVTLTEGHSSTVIRVQNTGGETLTLQIQPRRWQQAQQAQQADRLEPTRELVATPQIFRVKPGATQLVRVALLGKPDADQETAYRLVFDEIPSPPAADFVGVQVATRVTMPLFVDAKNPAKSGLKVTLKESTGGKLAIIADNQGHAHAHLKKFIVARPGAPAEAPLEFDAPAYLLPGTVREFIVPLPQGSFGPLEKLSVRAIGMTGAVEFDGLAQP
jgi:fimbrial chaperone protein